jgi:hypothetical protein
MGHGWIRTNTVANAIFGVWKTELRGFYYDHSELRREEERATRIRLEAFAILLYIGRDPLQ